jgi:DNA polymerase-3 subunit delta
MPTATEHAFRKAVTAGKFAPVYYLYGEDDFRKTEAMAAALAAAVPSALRDFNVDVRRGPDLDAEAVCAMLGTPPLIATRRAVALRDVQGLRKDARRELDRYLERPAADTLLLIVATAGSKPDRALSERAVAVEFQELKGDRLPAWIAHRAAAGGATITPEAAAFLQEAAGVELATLASELEKLVSYARGALGDAGVSLRPGELLLIDEAAVSAVVGVRRGETLGDLLDRVAERDIRRALPLVDLVLGKPKTTAVSVVMALATQTLALAWARARRDQGVSPRILASELESLLKETGAYPMRPWNEAISTWVRTVDRWTPAGLDRALAALIAADGALKETRLATDEQAIAALILTMCADAEEYVPGAGGAGQEAAA